MKTNPNRRDFLRTLGLGTASLALPGCLGPFRRAVGQAGGPFGKNGRPPNIVLILADDMGWRDAGFMGSSFYETPNIDRLAREGLVFTSAYTNAPNCAPTRASLLSGLYPPRTGVYTVGSSARGKAKLRKLIPIRNRTTLEAGAVTIAEALKPAGYVSASIGKWHLGDDPKLGPCAQGFDMNIAGSRAGHPVAGYFAPYELVNLEDAPKGEYLTDRLTEEALNFIDKNRDRPFFLYLPHYAVHTPLQAKKETAAKYRGKKGSGGQNNPVYAGMIESLDKGVGRILDRLDSLGLAGNTAVFFFSDNGGVQGITSMDPLRGGKGMLYEGGIRVPMIARLPGVTRPGTRCDTPVIGIDFYPTFLDLAGAPQPEGQILDGKSLLPLLSGAGPLVREAIFWHFPAYLQARKGVEGIEGPWRTTPAGAVRKGDFKLIEFFEDGKVELYDLKEDIGERRNLAAARPEKAAELLENLRAWRRAVKAPVPTEKNPRFDPAALEQARARGPGGPP